MASNVDILFLSSNAYIGTMSSNVDTEVSMLIRTPADLGAVVRDRRKRLGLGQATLAEKIGVSRQWVVGIERGHSRAELGLVMRTLDALGIRLETRDRDATPRLPSGPDIDAIVAAARKGRS
jgi:HTH-type transcriptional regulator / antitoxin HipB